MAAAAHPRCAKAMRCVGLQESIFGFHLKERSAAEVELARSVHKLPLAEHRVHFFANDLRMQKTE
jgi:hypothetical protein